MERNAQAVLKEALALSEADRAEVAGALLDCLEPVEEGEIESVCGKKSQLAWLPWTPVRWKRSPGSKSATGLLRGQVRTGRVDWAEESDCSRGSTCQLWDTNACGSLLRRRPPMAWSSARRMWIRRK